MDDSQKVPRPPPRAVGGPSRGGLSHASTISGSWSNASTSSPQPSISTSSVLQTAIKTTCLFCPNYVTLSVPLSESREVVAKRQQHLQNLCLHLKINGKVLPKNGTQIQFPFCTTCENHMSELMKLQKAMEMVTKKIFATVTTIERIVADREILGSKAPRSPSELQKFFKLYDMILEGYRNKLSMNFQRNNGMGTDGTSPNAIPDSSTSTSVDGRGYHAGFDGVGEVADETMEFSGDPLLDIGVEFKVGVADVSSSFSGQRQNDGNSDLSEEESYENGWAGANAPDNDNICNLVISNVQSTAAGASGCVGVAGIDGVVNVKPEVSAPANEEDEEEEEDDGDGTSANIYEVAERKRRLLSDGIEIFKCNGTGSRKDVDFLQCSQCTFTLPVQKRRRKEAKEDLTTIEKLKMHIKNVHKIKRSQPQVVRDMPCDICERPIKGHHNLLLHKFSHKNDEEKLEAMRNNDEGAVYYFLSANSKRDHGRKRKTSSNSRSFGSSKRSKNMKMKTRKLLAVTRASAAVGVAASVNNPPISVGGANPFGCRLCNAYFPMKIDLTQHLSTHGLRRSRRGEEVVESEPIASTSAAAVEREPWLFSLQKTVTLPVNSESSVEELEIPLVGVENAEEVEQVDASGIQ